MAEKTINQNVPLPRRSARCPVIGAVSATMMPATVIPMETAWELNVWLPKLAEVRYTVNTKVVATAFTEAPPASHRHQEIN